MIRTYSLLVILTIFLSTFTWMHYVNFLLLTNTFLVATESNPLHTTWNGLIANNLVDWEGQDISLQVEQLSTKARLRDAPFGFCNLVKEFKHNAMYLAIDSYCYCLMVSGKWWPIKWYRKINMTSFIFSRKNSLSYWGFFLSWNCNWKKRTLMLTFKFDFQKCQKFVS